MIAFRACSRRDLCSSPPMVGTAAGTRAPGPSDPSASSARSSRTSPWVEHFRNTPAAGGPLFSGPPNCRSLPSQNSIPFFPCRFGAELGAQANYEEKENQGVHAILMGSHPTADLQKLLGGFLTTYVLCPQCGLPEMDLKCNKTEENIYGKCKACGWNGLLKDASVGRLFLLPIIRVWKI